MRLPGVYRAAGPVCPAAAGRHNGRLAVSWTPRGGLHLTGVRGCTPVAWQADVWQDQTQGAIGAVPISQPTFHRLLAEHASRFLPDEHTEDTGYRLHPLFVTTDQADTTPGAAVHAWAHHA